MGDYGHQLWVCCNGHVRTSMERRALYTPTMTSTSWTGGSWATNWSNAYDACISCGASAYRASEAAEAAFRLGGAEALLEVTFEERGWPKTWL